MKARPMQRKPAQKRTLATVRTTARTTPNKRLQTRREETTPRSFDDNHAGDVDDADERVSPGSLQDVPPGNAGTPTTEERSAPPNEVRRPPSTPTINSIQPRNRSNSQIQPTLTPVMTTESMVELLKASEQRILKHMVSQQRTILARIAFIESTLKEMPASISRVKTGVADLKVMLLPGGSKFSSQRTSSRPRNQTKALKLQQEVLSGNPTLLAELTIVFNTDVACVAAAKTIRGQMEKFHSKPNPKLSVTSRAMNVFLYSYNLEMGKSATKEGIGFRHAEFRYKVAKAMLDLAKGLPDHLFSTEGEDSSPSGNQNGDLGLETKPSWLTSDFVKDSMSLARKHHEWFVSDLPKDPTEPLKRKALYIAKRFFKVCVEMLRQSREKCKLKMYEDGLFYLVNWEKLPWFPRNLGNPILSFLWPQEEVIAPSLIPESAVGDVDEVGATNAELLNTMISERKEMVIQATYDVMVSEEHTASARKKDEDKEQRGMTRSINILRISKSFMCGFCHLPEQDLLRAHPAMLQCMYRFALVIRDIFITHMPPDKRYVKPINSRASGRRGTQQRSQGDDTASHRPPRRQSESGSNGTGNDSHSRPPNSDGQAGDRGNRVEEPSSQARNTRGDSERTLVDRCKETPPIGLVDLFPAETEMDRVIDNHTDISVEMHTRTNVVTHGDTDEMVGVGQDEAVVHMVDDGYDSDSEEDNMSDVISDDD